MAKHKYRRIERDGISFNLPETLETRSELPRFSAMSSDEATSFLLEVNPDDVNWDGAREMIYQRLPDGQGIKCRVVRRGSVNTPYPGDELVFETAITETGRTSWQWCMTLTARSTRIDCQVAGPGAFRESEAVWRGVIDSIRVGESA